MPFGWKRENDVLEKTMATQSGWFASEKVIPVDGGLSLHRYMPEKGVESHKLRQYYLRCHDQSQLSDALYDLPL